MIPKISVIMPVYNAEKYLRHSIECILTQDFQEFELILVDDGSIDESGKICDEYAVRDSRVKVFHQKNQGTSAARNLGLDNALGDYITFSDDDDECYPGFLSENYKKAIETNADILCFSADREFKLPNGLIIEKLQYMACDFASEELSKQYTFIRSKVFFVTVWNHFYKREIIRNLRFNSIFKHGQEDILFNMEILLNVKNHFVFFPNVYYKHILRASSSSVSYSRQMKDISEYLFFFEKEFFFLAKFQNHDFVDVASAEKILIDCLYFVFQRIYLTKDKIRLLRKCLLFKEYPYKLSRKGEILLWSFKHSVFLYQILCCLNFNISQNNNSIVIETQSPSYYQTSLCGFFENLYYSKKGKRLYRVLNEIVKWIALPYQMKKCRKK